MIPKNIREGAVSEGLDGERVSFQIEANGKAFRTLIDGLYSNKVQAVIRELCSNAQDSHVEAGQTRPFEVSIPTHLDPTFRVRDFGVSLTHEGVMGLYTTIFKSTKESTNAQTGQLGLGSKSPFAYTDTFSVIAYLDGVRRVYVAYLETDGVPCINHVEDNPTDEPNGLEVSFPAKRQDMREFQTEMLRVSLAYEPGQIKVHGLEVKLPEPRLSGETWTLYPTIEIHGDRYYGGQPNFVRMGSVLYPVSAVLRNVSREFSVVVDVPIGICDVTASREALSMDDETRREVNQRFEVANNEIAQQVADLIEEASASGTRVSRALANAKYGKICDRVAGSTIVSLVSDKNKATHALYSDSERVPGDVLEAARYYGRGQNVRRGAVQRFISGLDVNQLRTVTVVLDDTDQKLVRRYRRVNNLAQSKANVWVFAGSASEIRKAKAWIKKCWEISDDQFLLASDVADCPPPKRSGTAKAARVRGKNQYWMLQRYGVMVSDIYGSETQRYTWTYSIRQAAHVAEIDLSWDEVFWVNEREMNKMKAAGELPDSHKLDLVIQRKVKIKAQAQPLDLAEAFVAVTNHVGRYNSALPVVLEEFFPNLVSMTNNRAEEIITLAKVAQLPLQNGKIFAKVKSELPALSEEYPLLFEKSGREHFQHYVEAVKASKAQS